MGRYELSPIKVVAIPRADYFCEITKVRPDAMLTWIFQLNEKPLLFLHHQDDIILIVALSNTILCLIYGALPDDEFPAKRYHFMRVSRHLEMSLYFRRST